MASVVDPGTPDQGWAKSRGSAGCETYLVGVRRKMGVALKNAVLRRRKQPQLVQAW